MSFNDHFKLFVLSLITIYCCVGVVFIGFAIYVLSADWGNLDKSFFFGSGLIVALVGILLIVSSYLGWQGVFYQLRRFGKFQGRKILLTYIVFLILLLLAEGYIYYYLHQMFEDFESARTSILNDNSYPDYTDSESIIARNFNRFFFGASSECTHVYSWFWNIVNDVCPHDISQSKCQACQSYYVTSCSADDETCYLNDDGKYGSLYTCPYDICRSQILNYTIKQYKMSSQYFQWGLFGLVGLQLLTCIRLYCYDVRKVTHVKVVPITNYIDGDDNDLLL